MSFEADGDLGIARDISHCHCQSGQQQVLGVGPVSSARGPEDLLAEARIKFHLEHTRLTGGPGEPRLDGASLHLVPVVVFLGNDPFPIRVESGRPLDERGRWRGQVDTLVSLGPPNGRRQVIGEDAPRHPVDEKVVGTQQQRPADGIDHPGGLEQRSFGEIHRPVQLGGHGTQGACAGVYVGHGVALKVDGRTLSDATDEKSVALDNGSQGVMMYPYGLDGRTDARLPAGTQVNREFLVEMSRFCEVPPKKGVDDRQALDAAPDFPTRLVSRFTGTHMAGHHTRGDVLHHGWRGQVIACPPQARDDANRLDRVATQLQEAVYGADVRHPQHLGECLAHHAFRRRSGFRRRSLLARSRLGQRPLVDLTVAVQGDLWNLGELRWHHVMGQQITQLRPDRREIQFPGSDDEAAQLDGLRGGRLGDHHRVHDSGNPLEGVLDLPKLDPEPPDLHLIINPTRKLNVPIRQPTRQIPRPIQPTRTKRIRHKLRRRQLRPIHIPQSQPLTSNTQLTKLTHTTQPHPRHNMHLRIRRRPPNRHPRTITQHNPRRIPGGGLHGVLSRAIGVDIPATPLSLAHNRRGGS